MAATNFKINEHQQHPTTIYRVWQKIFEWSTQWKDMKRPYNVRFRASLSGFLHDSGIQDAKLPLWSQIQLCRSGAFTSVRLFLTPDYVKSPLPLAQRKKGTPHKTGSRPVEPNVTVAHERRQDMYAHDWHKHTRKDTYHPPCAAWLHVGQVWRKHIFFILGVAFGFASASSWLNLPLSSTVQTSSSKYEPKMGDR